MTVETTVSRAQYNTNGTTGPWTVPFYFIESGDLSVIYTDADGNESELVLDVGYTVTGAGDPTGTVTTTTAYPAGGYITVLRDVEALQSSDYVNGDDFPAETLERDLDRLMQLIQQLLEVVGRSLVFAPSDTEGSTLPSAALRASKMLGFDADGRLFVMAPVSGSAADVLLQLLNYTLDIKLRTVASGGGSGTPYSDASFLSTRLITTHAWYDYLVNGTFSPAGGAPIYGHASFNSNMTVNGAVNLDHHHDYQAYPHISLTGGTTMNVLSCFFAQPDINGGSILEVAQFKGNDPLGSGGTINNLYGVKIESLTRGLNNYAFFSGGTTKSLFGGDVQLGQPANPASVAYNYTTGHLDLTPRATYKVRALSEYLLIGADADPLNAASLRQNSSTGDLEVSPRPTYKVRVLGALEVVGPVQVGAYTVATLPSAAAYPRGLANVSDANSTTFNAIVAGGGANNVGVRSDGTNWRIG